MTEEMEREAVAVLHKLEISYWSQFQEPLSLSAAGQEVSKIRAKYPRRSNSKLKDFVLRTEAEGLYKLVEHSTNHAFKGLIPHDVDFDEAGWLSPIERHSLLATGSTSV